MGHKERVIRAFERKPVDRTPLWYGVLSEEVLEKHLEYFGLSTEEELRVHVGDDLRWTPKAYGLDELPFFNRYDTKQPNSKIFAQCTDIRELEKYDWPDTKSIDKLIDMNNLKEKVAQYSQFATLGGSWSPFFHDVAEFFGMDNYFIKMYTNPDIVEAVTERIVNFYLAINEKIFTAAEGAIDIYFLGNDYGTQRDLLMNPEMFKRFILPYVKRLVEQAKSFGLKVMHHSDGAIFKIIPYLIEIGVDALHPIQIEAKGMSPEKLAKEFKDHLTFVGGIDIQRLLRMGTPDKVRENVRYMKKLFGDGYIVSTSHESVLPDIPVENIEAMFNEAKEKII